MKKERNPNIELWRCCCMLAVVSSHVLVNNGICGFGGFMWHIPGFLLISGYFGIRFSFRKMIKLVGIAYACYWLTIPFRDWAGFASLLLPHGGWFLPFYCVLMLLSPLLNAALENEKAHRVILTTTLALVLIGWIPTLITSAHAKMIAVPGMQGNGVLLMMATYVLGAMLSKYEIARKHRSAVWLALFVVGIASLVLMGLFVPSACHYLSPVSLATAVCGLMFFIAAPKLPYKIGQAVNFIAPSMFGVYLVHECCIKKYQYLSGGGDAIVRTVILFLAALGIDMVRRLIEYAIAKLIVKVK